MILDYQFVIEQTAIGLKQKVEPMINSGNWIPHGSITVMLDSTRNKYEYMLQVAEVDPQMHIISGIQDYQILIEQSAQDLKARSENLVKNHDWFPFENIVTAVDIPRNITEYILQLVKFDPNDPFAQFP